MNSELEKGKPISGIHGGSMLIWILFSEWRHRVDVDCIADVSYIFAVSNVTATKLQGTPDISYAANIYIVASPRNTIHIIL